MREGSLPGYSIFIFLATFLLKEYFNLSVFLPMALAAAI